MSVKELVRDGVTEQPQDNWYVLKAGQDGSGRDLDNGKGYIAQLSVRFWMPETAHGKSPEEAEHMEWVTANDQMRCETLSTKLLAPLPSCSLASDDRDCIAALRARIG